MLQDIPHPSSRRVALLEAEVREIVESLQAQLQESEPLVADLQDTKIHQDTPRDTKYLMTAP